MGARQMFRSHPYRYKNNKKNASLLIWTMEKRDWDAVQRMLHTEKGRLQVLAALAHTNEAQHNNDPWKNQRHYPHPLTLIQIAQQNEAPDEIIRQIVHIQRSIQMGLSATEATPIQYHQFTSLSPYSTCTPTTHSTTHSTIRSTRTIIGSVFSWEKRSDHERFFP
mmetsp:Transcript_14228/g.25820  ORF Transcript_14228/g.25820 Transcript_14228/m.25820 type:complete len:165 (+) Transcript_14228:228-722(+)